MTPLIETIGKGLVAVGWFLLASVQLWSWTAQVRNGGRAPQA
jgi:hypothetical protein